MATYDLEEQEKIDELKSWWEVYGTLVIVIAAICIAGVFGTQLWNHYQKQQSQQAAELFISLQQIELSKDPKKIGDAARLLMEGFSDSGFASRAAMIAAYANVDIDDTQNTRGFLQWVLDNSKENELRDLARLRLVSLLLDQKRHDEALKLLGNEHAESFDGLYEDLKGDIFTAKGNIPEARVAYQIAINKIGIKSGYRNIIQMKLDALIVLKQ
ncbi:MAG: tetratricopeptide repeat protein [Nitrosospira sp.]|jgi:predicted negative regulator of RcsB-dependent stress response|nr:tetratricopeptide repeat protein [Nitrosospira sp.]MDW7642447.1 tetratricopeptide repeat protein [Nitrosomonadaceae bacterium]MBI0407527.1 tetratricopeptide repeat protein [Nitrosospira sp.]MBI0414806.1 tetratricopeptide repeat protein [Nitrosospira sp.]MBI0415741.1 tetratricopeptide repeat protein [Nitrosospira sp.]